MRLFEIAPGAKQDLTFDEAIATVLDNCQDYLSSDIVLYRGARKSDDQYIAMPREDRRQLIKNELSLAVFNDVMSHIGSSARKNNSVSFTDFWSIATSYGTLHYVFPYDGAEFSWSKHDDFLLLADLTMFINTMREIGLSQDQEKLLFAKLHDTVNTNRKGITLYKWLKEEFSDMMPQVFDTIVEKNEFRTGSVQEIKPSRRGIEIVMTGKPYVVFNASMLRRAVKDDVENKIPESIKRKCK